MINLDLPKDAIVRGSLYHTKDPSWLTQDVLEVALPNGVVIDVGWHPEHDLNGTFWIRVFLNDWDHRLTDPIHRDDPNEVKETVEQLAQHYRRNLISKCLASNLIIEDRMTA